MYMSVFCLQPPPDAVYFNLYGQPENVPPENYTVSLAWRGNGPQFVDFIMEGEAEGWIALGITADALSLDNVKNTFVCILSTKHVLGMVFIPVYIDVHTRKRTYVY